MRDTRRRNVLVLPLVMTSVLGALGTAFALRVQRAGRTAAWSARHLALRLLAESAVDEIFLAVQVAAGDVSNPYFTIVRSNTTDQAALPARAAERVQLELARRGGAPGARTSLQTAVQLARRVPVPGGDARESSGVLRFESSVTMECGPRIVERVRVDRTLRHDALGGAREAEGHAERRLEAQHPPSARVAARRPHRGGSARRAILLKSLPGTRETIRRAYRLATGSICMRKGVS